MTDERSLWEQVIIAAAQAMRRMMTERNLDDRELARLEAIVRLGLKAEGFRELTAAKTEGEQVRTALLQRELERKD
ncbi:MAG TPA: hypothetical protein VI792_03195 [Candidatus Eisenbacteria bacterium]